MASAAEREQIATRILHYASEWPDGGGSPLVLANLLEAGFKVEYLEEFDAEKNVHVPTIHSELLILATQYFVETGALADGNTLWRQFIGGAAALLAGRLGLSLDFVKAEAWKALKAAAGDTVANGSDVALLVREAQEDYEGGCVSGLLRRGALKTGELKPRAILNYLVDEAHKIQTQTGHHSPILSLKDSTDRRIERYQSIVQDPTKAQGLQTGFDPYDKRTGGIYPGEVVLITGITKLGKSLFRDKILSNIWMSGHSCVTILSEFYASVAQTRIECMAMASLGIGSGNANLTLSQALKRGGLGEEQREKYYEMLRAFSELPGDFLFIEPTAYERLDELEAHISHLKSKYNIQAIGVDDIHNQMLTQMRGERDDLRQGEVFNWLRMIGKRYEVAVIAEVQEDKSTAGRRVVQWSDVVKYSAKLTQKTDVGIRLFKTANIVYPEVQVLAHRNENDGDFNFRIKMDKDSLLIEDSQIGVGESYEGGGGTILPTDEEAVTEFTGIDSLLPKLNLGGDDDVEMAA